MKGKRSSVKKSEIERELVYEHTTKNGVKWPHGKGNLIKIIEQEQVEIKLMKVGQMSDGSEYVYLMIDKISLENMSSLLSF